MSFTPNQQNNLASKARDIASRMQELESLCLEYERQWVAGGWASEHLTDLTGDNASINPDDIVAMVTSAQAFAAWFDSSGNDTNAAKLARYT